MATMTDAQKRAFKEALEAKRQELVRDIHAQATEMAVVEVENDPLDQLRSMDQRDYAATMLQSLSRTLSDVDNSLHAMSMDSYGLCTECGKVIDFKRLATIPWASYCIRCQQIVEGQDASERSSLKSGVRSL